MSAELTSIFIMLEECRARVLMGRDYELSIKDYETIIKNISRFSQGCSNELLNKIDKLKDRMQSELRFVRDLSREYSTFPREPSSGCKFGDNLEGIRRSDQLSDPDVWPPPTPVAGARAEQKNDGRRQILQPNENLPAWARGKEPDKRQIQVSPSPQLRRPSENGKRIGADDASRAAAMRKERDSVPTGRKRYKRTH